MPSVVYEIRYEGEHNFIGRRIDGYKAPKCLLAKEAAIALGRVQKELKARSLSLKVFDCYRPQRAVNHFVTWAKDPSDTKMKKEFYPHVEKKNLFKKGYIASKSAHSRGSAVDLTIASLDMGTPFDFFGPKSHTNNPDVSVEARKNRELLKGLMEKQGFKNYSKEWWHYSLKEEPFPDRYFDFEVE